MSGAAGADSSEPVIVADEVTKIYPPPPGGFFALALRLAGRNPTPARRPGLDRLSLSVQRGEVFGLLGANGAGKTTFCKLLSGLVEPTHGSVQVFGCDVSRNRVAALRSAITVLGTERETLGLFSPRLGIEINLRFAARLWGVKAREAERRIGIALEYVRLSHARAEPFQRLSAGEKQRASLALCLCLPVELLILDEPTVSLDPVARREFESLIAGAMRENPRLTVLLTSHDLAQVERLCDRVALLGQGRLIALDTPEAVARSGVIGQRMEFLVVGAAAAERNWSATLPPGFGCERVEQTREGTQVSVRSDSSDDAVARLMHALMSAGVEIRWIEAPRPTLEEAMLNLEAGGRGTPDGLNVLP